MASVSVSHCFQVLVNGISSSIESNLTIFNLTWNSVLVTFSILETRLIGMILAISHMIWGNFNAINPILSIFYGCSILFAMNYDECNCCGYQNDIIFMIKLQYIILVIMYEIKMMILSSYHNFYLVCTYMLILSKTKSYCSGYVRMIINIHNSGINSDVLCKNQTFTVDKYNLSNNTFDINVCVCMFY